MKISKLKKIDILFLAVVAIMIFAAFFWGCTFIPIKHSINKSVSGISWNPELEHDFDEVVLKMNGCYYDYILELFGHHDYFRGTMEISNIAETADPAFAYFTVSGLPDSDIRQGVLSYVSKSDSYHIGYLYITNKNPFSQILIESEDKTYVFPAFSMEQAQESKKQMESWKTAAN